MSVSLQLVREADLRSAVLGAVAGECRRRSGVAEGHLPSRSPVDRGRHFRIEAWLDRSLLDACGRAAGRHTVQVSASRRRRHRRMSRERWREPGAAPRGSAPSPARRRFSTRWRRARASNRSTRRRAMLQAAGIEVGFFLQFGYPGETLAHIDRTLQMVRDCMPDDIGVSVSYPLPGTPFYERVKAQLGEQAELGGFERSRDDVSGNVRARVLPRAPCARACRVPFAAPAFASRPRRVDLPRRPHSGSCAAASNASRAWTRAARPRSF